MHVMNVFKSTIGATVVHVEIVALINRIKIMDITHVVYGLIITNTWLYNVLAAISSS